MGLAQALYTGVTGLSVNSDNMSVIANNIANANSTAFKRDRAEFEDMVSQQLKGGSAKTQIGRGARLAQVKTMHTQGGTRVTDNLTDIAIQGQGFFVVSNPDSDVNESAGKFFTRVGNLHFDKDGFFATPSGGRVQGYIADAAGNLSSRLTDVRIETNTIAPKATDILNINTQLDSRVDVMEGAFDTTAPEKTSNFNTSMTVFDSHGRAHQSTVFFKKLSGSNEGTDWEWHAVVDGKEVVDGVQSQLKEYANGTIKFDKNGFLLEETTKESSVTFSNGALPNQKINFDFGANVGVENGTGANASTSIAGKSVLVYHQQDGFEAGQIKSLNVGLNGIVTGVFTNGIQRPLAAIALSTFSNEDALNKVGKNLFASSIESGPANIGLPQTGTRGTLFASSLEESNVDLASEFVNMITTQRLFQASSRTITTADNLIEEVINLKR